MTAQPEITTAAERAQTGDTASTEPLMTLTQLQGLLREAAAIERAQRPIVIRPSAEAFPAAFAAQLAPAPQTDGGHLPPVGARPVLPTPFEAPWAPVRHLPATRRGWGLRLAYTSMAVLVAGAASGVVVGTAAGPVGMCVGGIVGAVAGTARAVHEQNREQNQ